MYRRILKRLLDFAVSAFALIILSPFLAMLSLLVAVRLGRPILFTQTRPGLHGKPFTIYKFRTMTNERDADGHLLPDAQRLTPFGRFLRSTSLDELPELFNVLKGDMSLVGPRPLLMRYLPYYTMTELRRHDLRPGITGHAQIQGRNTVGWTERLAMDVWYVDHLSLLLDLKIILQTFVRVLRRADVVVIPMTVMKDLDEERQESA